jgi:hypothetical protein
LEREYVLGLAVKARVPSINDLQIAAVGLITPLAGNVGAKGGFDILGAVAPLASELVNGLNQICG